MTDQEQSKTTNLCESLRDFPFGSFLDIYVGVIRVQAHSNLCHGIHQNIDPTIKITKPTFSVRTESMSSDG
jgi:hypothetical protein